MTENYQEENQQERESQELLPVKQGFQAIEEVTMSEQEAAYALRMSKGTLSGIRRRNGITYRKTTKGRVLYLVEDVLQYLQHVRRNAKFVSD